MLSLLSRKGRKGRVVNGPTTKASNKYVRPPLSTVTECLHAYLLHLLLKLRYSPVREPRNKRVGVSQKDSPSNHYQGLE